MSGYREPVKETPAPAVPPPTDPPKVPPTEPPKEAAGGDDEVDELGYAKVKAEEPNKDKPAEKPVAAKTDDDKEPEVKATGYAEEPAKPEEKPKVEDKPAEKKAEGATDEFEIKEKGELQDDEVKALKDFIKANKVPKEIAEALVERSKSDAAKFKQHLEERKKEREKAELKQKNDWYNELKTDPNFGGEKFAHNVKRVEKVMEDFLPSLKKKLTDSKGMLPPYLMRDLVKLGDHLYSTGKLIKGDPPAPPPENKGSDDPLEYYNQPS